MAKKQQERRYGPALWADQVEAPRADLHLPGDGSRTLALYKVGIYSALIGVPLLIILCIALLSKVSSAPTDSGSPQAQQGQISVHGRAQAVIAVTEWLAETPAPLPGGHLITWTGSQVVSTPGTETKKDDDDAVDDPASFTTYVIQSFSVADGSGNLYTASVEVATDGRPGGGSKAISGVSLIPDTPAADDAWIGDSPWPGLSPVTAPGPVATAVSAWAVAYTSGDSATLGQAIGDPDPTHSYVPMSGVSSIVASPVAAAWTDATHAVMTVQVALDIAWNGQPSVDPNSVHQPAFDTVLDVLVQKADTAAPVVVAWAAPGSGPSLKPYSNAVSNEAPRGLPTTGADSSGTIAPGTTESGPASSQNTTTGAPDTSTTATQSTPSTAPGATTSVKPPAKNTAGKTTSAAKKKDGNAHKKTSAPAKTKHVKKKPGHSGKKNK